MLADVCGYIQRGKSPKYADHSSLPIVNQKSIRWNGIQSENLKYVDPVQFSAWTAERYIKVGDILWNSTGTGTIGRACLVKFGDINPPKVVDSHVTILRPNFLFDSRYVFYWIKSPTIQEKIENLSSGSTNQVELNRAIIAETLIPVAPFSEQKRIADKLDTLLAAVDGCRARLDKVPTLIKRFRQSVLAAATTGALTEDWRDAHKLQQSNTWESVSLMECADSLSYGTSSKSNPTGTTPVLRMGNIQNGKLDLTDLVFTSEPAEIKKYALRFGDVLFNRTNSPELVGKTAVYKGQQPTIYAGYLIRVRCNEKLHWDFLNYCLNSPFGRDYCWQVKTDGVSQSNINAKKLAALRIHLPAMEEQREIVRRVETLFAIADKLEDGLATARKRIDQLTPAVLAQAFRGELIEQDPSDEPAMAFLAGIAAIDVPVLPVLSRRALKKAA